MKWVAAVIGAVIGYNVGWYSVGIGSHGGDAWPTLVFCGPAYLLAAGFGDNLGYVWALIIGTAALYGGYAWCLFHLRRWSVLLVVVLIHVPFILMAISTLNSN